MKFIDFPINMKNNTIKGLGQLLVTTKLGLPIGGCIKVIDSTSLSMVCEFFETILKQCYTFLGWLIILSVSLELSFWYDLARDVGHTS